MTALKKKIASDTVVDGDLSSTTGHITEDMNVGQNLVVSGRTTTNTHTANGQTDFQGDVVVHEGSKVSLLNTGTSSVLTSDASGDLDSTKGMANQVLTMKVNAGQGTVEPGWVSPSGPAEGSSAPATAGALYTEQQARIIADAGKAPTDHSSSTTQYGAGTSVKYGHVKFDTSLTGERTDVAISEKGVRDFVNSSVSTATANFLGTYDAHTDLGFTTVQVDAFTDPPSSQTESDVASALVTKLTALHITPTNNDYVFVSVDKSSASETDWFWRFKYANSVWKYEYTLNNSTFTEAQWDAINSGLTSADKTTIDNIGDARVNIIGSGANILGTFTTNQGGEAVDIILPDGSAQYLNQSAAFVLQSTPDYPDYPYRADVPISNVTAGMFAYAVYSDAQVASCTYSANCDTYDGGVYLYASSDVGTVTIPTISVGFDRSMAMDSVPTDGSTNAVMSGGVWSAIGSDSRVVHTSGNETIAGAKTFSSLIKRVGSLPEFRLIDNVLTYNSIPAQERYAKVMLCDKNEVELGYTSLGINSTNGDGYGQIRVFSYDRAYNNRIIVRSFANGTGYCQIDKVRTYDPSNTSDIVTIGSLQASTDVVHTSGNETIAGSKKFTDNLSVRGDSEKSYIVVNTSVTRGTIPSSNTRTGSLRITDDANGTLGELYHVYDSTGESQMIMNAIRNASSRVDMNMVLHQKQDGTGYVTAPFRTYDASKTTDVVTIGTLQASTDVVHTSGNETVGGVKNFSTQLTVTGIWDNKVSQNIENSSTWRRIYYTTATDLGNQVLTLLVTPQKGVNGETGIIGFYATQTACSCKWLVAGTGIVNNNFALVKTSTGSFEIWAKNADGNRGLSFMKLNETSWGNPISNWTRDLTTKNASFDPTTYANYAYPTSDNLVHTINDETIAGIKTFSGALYLASAGYDLNNPPSYTTRSLLTLKTKSDLSQIASLDNVMMATGGNSRNLYIYAKDFDGNDVTSMIQLTAFRDGTDRIRVVHPNGSNDNIVTASVLDGYTPMVRTTGNQTIAGQKTFSGGPSNIFAINQTGNPEVIVLNAKDYDVTDGVTHYLPTAISMHDKNGVMLGRLRFFSFPDGRVQISLDVRNADGTTKNVLLAEGNS